MEIPETPEAAIANFLCSNGICGGDRRNAPCETARKLADGAVEALNAAGFAVVQTVLTDSPSK